MNKCPKCNLILVKKPNENFDYCLRCWTNYNWDYENE
jgi:hypothetical protein